MKKTIDSITFDTQSDKMIGTILIDKDPCTTQTLYLNQSKYLNQSNIYYLYVTLGTKENICPIDLDEAKLWCKHWLTKSEYNEYFKDD